MIMKKSMILLITLSVQVFGCSWNHEIKGDTENVASPKIINLRDSLFALDSCGSNEMDVRLSSTDSPPSSFQKVIDSIFTFNLPIEWTYDGRPNCLFICEPPMTETYLVILKKSLKENPNNFLELYQIRALNAFKATLDSNDLVAIDLVNLETNTGVKVSYGQIFSEKKDCSSFIMSDKGFVICYIESNNCVYDFTLHNVSHRDLTHYKRLIWNVVRSFTDNDEHILSDGNNYTKIKMIDLLGDHSNLFD